MAVPSPRSGTRAGARLAQPDAQPIPGDDQGDDGHRDLSEQGDHAGGEVVGDRARTGGLSQPGRRGVQPVEPIQDELGEELVEVGEMPVQDTLGDARLGGDGAAGEGARPVSDQDALGRFEELLTGVT